MKKILFILIFILLLSSCFDDYKIIDSFYYKEGNAEIYIVILYSINGDYFKTIIDNYELFLLSEKFDYVITKGDFNKFFPMEIKEQKGIE